MSRDRACDATFEALEREQLRTWMRLDACEKIAFFEEMVELAYLSGALRPERLALRDAPHRPEL